MKTIKPGVVKKLKEEALDYITLVKGKKLTKEDIKTAETLIIFGFLKAKLGMNKLKTNIPELYLG